jgi:proteasome component ECM29
MKDVEIQFTIGEALVCAALGLNSPESRDPWTVKERDFVEPDNAPSQLDFLLDELLNKYVAHLNPNVKQVINSEFYSFLNILRVNFSNRLPRSGYWP